ncbi:MAG: hypothetical protein ACTHMY_01205 [Solirubrobacteraceae bacterium]
MRLQAKLAVIVGAMVLGAFPSMAVGNAGGHPNTSTSPTKTSKAKAYGKFCQGESKTHVAGTPGTPFSKCVTDMAKVANGSVTNPAKACKDESKKHVAGEPGTPYSVCVSGAKKLLKQQAGG